MTPAIPSPGRRLDLAQRWLRFMLSASALNPHRMTTLPQDMFAGKRVIIVGPAETVIDDLRNVRVDDYDVIVRMNNGLFLADGDPERLGSRTDVLFHNLTETGPRGTMPIPPDALLSRGVKTCIFPHWSFKGSKARVYRKRDELKDSGVDLRVPPVRFCSRLRHDLDGFQPTVGTSAIIYFLGCPLAELAIHGFTFFQTVYQAGYNDTVRTQEDARKWVAASEVHDAARERQLISRRVAEMRIAGMKIELGRNVGPYLREGADLPT